MNPIITNLVTKVHNDSEEKLVRLSDNHPRRITTGLKRISYDKNTKTCEAYFKPILKSKLSDIDAVYVTGTKDNIKKMFNEINILLKKVGGNKSAAVMEYLSGNLPVSFNSSYILKSLERLILKK